MDQFEAARLKHAKSLERKNRVQEQPEPVVYIERPETPTEKPVKSDAVIEVLVSLPGGDFSFTLVKPSVTQNAVMSKLTRSAFMNAMMKGLEPLLGAVKEK